MKKLIYILVILACSSTAKPQYSALADFFPLKTGNKWVYGNVNKLPPSFTIHVFQLTKDTMIDGHKYFFFTEGNYWMRFDSLSGNLLIRADGMGCGSHPDDYVLDSLNAQEDDHISCGRPPYWKHLCLERSDSIRKFYEDDILVRRRDYKYGVGVETFIYTEGFDSYFDLRGYVLNGVAYGDTSLTGIVQTGTEIPESFQLHQNYPNPFNPSTKISFEIPSRMFVRLNVYDISGRLVAKLIDEQLPSGKYESTFESHGLSSGIYYYELTAGNFKAVKKMAVVK